MAQPALAEDHHLSLRSATNGRPCARDGIAGKRTCLHRRDVRLDLSRRQRPGTSPSGTTDTNASRLCYGLHSAVQQPSQYVLALLGGADLRRGTCALNQAFQIRKLGAFQQLETSKLFCRHPRPTLKNNANAAAITSGATAPAAPPHRRAAVAYPRARIGREPAAVFRGPKSRLHAARASRTAA